MRLIKNILLFSCIPVLLLFSGCNDRKTEAENPKKKESSHKEESQKGELRWNGKKLSAANTREKRKAAAAEQRKNSEKSSGENAKKANGKKSGQNGSGQNGSGQGTAGQNDTGQGGDGQGTAGQNGTGQGTAGQNGTGQGGGGQGTAGQNGTGQGGGGQGTAGQNGTGQGGDGQGTAGQNGSERRGSCGGTHTGNSSLPESRPDSDTECKLSADKKKIWFNILTALKKLIVAKEVSFLPLDSGNSKLQQLADGTWQASGCCVITEISGRRISYHFKCIAKANQYEAVITQTDFEIPNNR